MEACPKTELIAIEDPATVCDGSLAIGEGREAQMIRHMRHGSPPRLMAPQPTLSLPSAPTVGNPLRPLQPETVSKAHPTLSRCLTIHCRSSRRGSSRRNHGRIV